MKIKELKLTSGWTVRCRPVPPLAQTGAMDGLGLHYPPPPKISVKTVTGEEETDAPEESEEYVAYFEACGKVDEARERKGRDFTYAYGVREWSEDGKKWLKEPPKGWKPDPILVEAIGDVGDRRTAFIMYELIVSAKDLKDVNGIILFTGLDLLKVQEVESAEDFFQDPVQGDAA